MQDSIFLSMDFQYAAQFHVVRFKIQITPPVLRRVFIQFGLKRVAFSQGVHGGERCGCALRAGGYDLSDAAGDVAGCVDALDVGALPFVGLDVAMLVGGDADCFGER